MAAVKKRTPYNKKFNKTYCTRAKKYLAKGYSIRALIGHLKISPDTHHQWRKTYPEYDDAIKQGQAECEQFYLDKGLKMIDTGKGNASVLSFFMKNILRYKDNPEGEQAPQPIVINFQKVDEGENDK